MKIPNLFSRKVMILALGLILTIFTLSWLFGGSQTNAQSDDPSQPLSVLAATGTGFTYQGHLNQSSAPANGSFTFRFVLYDSAAGGAQIGSPQTKTITVSEGLFTTTLNEAGEFGATAFNGEARYLEIRVSDNGGTSYTTLTPRQSLTAAPYAHSLRPGAVINSTVAGGAILNLTNNGSGSGLTVGSAGVGVQVNQAGTGFYVSDASSNGVLVDSAVTGVNVGSAATGVSVASATGAGVQVNSAGTGVNVADAAIGLRVVSATANGVEVDSAPTGVNIVNSTNGVYVANATTHGLVVGSAANGVYVQSASTNGVHVESATGNGLQVESANNGVQVDSVTNSGYRVDSAPNGVGFRVAAADTGVYVVSATNWAGYFTGDINVTGACTGCVLAAFGVNTDDSPLQPGDVVALQGTRSGESIGQPLLMEVGPAQAGAPVVGVVYGYGELTNVDGHGDQPIMQLAPREGAAQPGDYVHIVIYGPMQVKASALGSAIQMGDKLSINNNGAARSLQTRTLNGMTITESAPTIGIALESLANKDGLIWVLVNPQ